MDMAVVLRGVKIHPTFGLAAGQSISRLWQAGYNLDLVKAIRLVLVA